VGAFFSRRAGGTRPVRLGAAMFPCGILLSAMLIVIGIRVVARALGSEAYRALDLALLVKPVAVAIVIPSIAMLAGASLFLLDAKRSAAA
jgi:hypothetical protein